MICLFGPRRQGKSAAMALVKSALDKRLKCPYCGILTWMTDYRAFMRDHDRPDGRRCRKAANHERWMP